METYPVMIEGALAGKLTVDVQGPRTVFEAECGMRPELVRLSVYGEGREGYLGVLTPKNGKLWLRRTLSRGQMREFPTLIDVVEPSGRAAEVSATPMEASPPAETPSSSQAPPPVQTESEVRNEDAQSAPDPDADFDSNSDDLLWYASPDGALVCYDGTQTLLALLPSDERVPPDIPARRRSIEGREYLVYRTENGRIV